MQPKMQPNLPLGTPKSTMQILERSSHLHVKRLALSKLGTLTENEQFNKYQSKLVWR